MRYTYQVWAPPSVFWWPSLIINETAIIGQATFSISFETISQAPSPFELEITYWQGSLEKRDIVVGPGSYRFSMDCACVGKVRARSYSIGQVVEVIIYVP